MNYVLMLITVLVSGAQSIFRKQYNLKTEEIVSAPFVFNFAASLAAMVFLLFFGLADCTFHLPTVLFALCFGLLSEVAMVTILYAFQYGSLSLTSLLLSYSIIMPALYGIAVLHEPFRVTTGIGLVLLAVSLYLFNWKKETFHFSKKWLIFVILLFLANGTCAILMKVHQVYYPEQYQTEFQGISFAVVAVINAVILLFLPRKGIKRAFIKSAQFAVPFGVCNVGANLLTMVLSAAIPAAVLFPVVSGGGIVTAYWIGRFLYKERMTAVQNIAFLVSLVSVVVLNL